MKLRTLPSWEVLALGKPLSLEAMLFESGVIKRRGSVLSAKNTVSDYFPVEQEYGYSVILHRFHVEWKDKKVEYH